MATATEVAEPQETQMALALHPASKPRKLRPAALHGRGGASSMLRLTRAATALPSSAAITGWMARAGSSLDTSLGALR